VKPIVLLDPALPGFDQTHSDNLGDVIIRDAVEKILRDLFPGDEIIRLPTKRPLGASGFETLRRCRFAFLGGTNLFSADLAAYNQWRVETTWREILFPKFSNVIALGVGWWQYQGASTIRTKLFYKRVLSSTLRILCRVAERFRESFHEGGWNFYTVGRMPGH
jgi:hypothetical protein